MKRISLLLIAHLSVALLSGCSEFGSELSSELSSKAKSSRIFGIVERPQIQLSSPSLQRITQFNVTKGERVQQGQLLVQLDNEIQQQQVLAAQSQLAQLESALHLLKAGTRAEQLEQSKAHVQAAEANLLEAKRQVTRQTELIKSNLTSQHAVDSAQAQLDAATAAHNEAKARLAELQNGARFETVQQAEIAIESARAHLAIAQKQLSELSLYAPVAGIVEDLPWHVGERPPVGAPIVLIANLSETFARLYLPEDKLAQVKLGMTLQLGVDGLAEPLSGTVSYISQSASFTPYFALSQQERARLMYVIEVTLPNSTTLPSGTPVWMVLP